MENEEQMKCLHGLNKIITRLVIMVITGLPVCFGQDSGPILRFDYEVVNGKPKITNIIPKSDWYVIDDQKLVLKDYNLNILTGHDTHVVALKRCIQIELIRLPSFRHKFNIYSLSAKEQYGLKQMFGGWEFRMNPKELPAKRELCHSPLDMFVIEIADDKGGVILILKD